jgi:16S rRNA G966 N2-methylase RsmD
MALVADAIKDCSRRGQIVLDLFAGSGTTLIAAHKTGRCARLIEFDPAHCDQIVRRFGQITGKQVILAATRQSFEVVAEKRGLSTVPQDIPAPSAPSKSTAATIDGVVRS